GPATWNLERAVHVYSERVELRIIKMTRRWRYTMLVGSAAAALSLSALGSVAEPERGDKGYDKGSKSDMDRDRGSQKSYGDRDKEPAAKVREDRDGGDRDRIRRGDNDGDRRWNRPGDRDR